MEPPKNDTAFFKIHSFPFAKRETNFIASIFAILNCSVIKNVYTCDPNVFPSILSWKKNNLFFSCKKGPCLEVQVGTIHGLSKESPSAYEAQAPS